MAHFNLRYFLESLGKKHQHNIFVLQIGAMDGKTFDPIHPYITKYNWHGLLVEPIAQHFQALQITYQDHPQLQFVQAAIGDDDGQKTMHYVPKELIELHQLPKWSQGLASFFADRNALAFESIQPFVQQHTVPSYRLNTLLTKHQVKEIDLLQIDAEGYDYQILKQFDFEKYQPYVIHFEIVNLSKAEQTAAKKLLDLHGYLHAKAGYDLIAVASKFFKEFYM